MRMPTSWDLMDLLAYMAECCVQDLSWISACFQHNYIDF